MEIATAKFCSSALSCSLSPPLLVVLSHSKFTFSVFPPPCNLKGPDDSMSQPRLALCVFECVSVWVCECVGVCMCACVHVCVLSQTHIYTPTLLPWETLPVWVISEFVVKQDSPRNLSVSLFSFMSVLLSELWLGWGEPGGKQGGFSKRCDCCCLIF